MTKAGFCTGFSIKAIKHFQAVALILMVLAGLLLSGCGSIGVDRLLSAADQGIVVAQTNDQILIEALRRQIQADIKNINRGFDRDVDLVSSNALSHADGSPVVMDADWVKEARIGYFLLLDGKYKQLRDLEKTHSRIEGNLKTTEQLLERARELNKGYLSLYEPIDHLLEQIENKDMSTPDNLNE